MMAPIALLASAYVLLAIGMSGMTVFFPDWSPRSGVSCSQ
jgi:hypothetical protein